MTYQPFYHGDSRLVEIFLFDGTNGAFENDVSIEGNRLTAKFDDFFDFSMRLNRHSPIDTYDAPT